MDATGLSRTQKLCGFHGILRRAASGFPTGSRLIMCATSTADAAGSHPAAGLPKRCRGAILIGRPQPDPKKNACRAPPRRAPRRCFRSASARTGGLLFPPPGSGERYRAFLRASPHARRPLAKFFSRGARFPQATPAPGCRPVPARRRTPRAAPVPHLCRRPPGE